MSANMMGEYIKVMDKCKEIDQNLTYKNLPVQCIVKDFIIGEPLCNYEIYLRELLNNSEYFMSLSQGEEYVAPIKEDDKECDAITEQYKIDFKLLVSSSYMEGTSNLSSSITKISEGMTGVGKCRGKRNQKVSLICQSLRYKSLSDLTEIANNVQKELCNKDIKKFLEKMQTSKNIILFLPVSFIDEAKREFDEVVNAIKKALLFDLRASMKYREECVPGFETYICTCFNDKMFFFSIASEEIKLVDLVDLGLSNTYMRLMDYTM